MVLSFHVFVHYCHFLDMCKILFWTDLLAEKEEAPRGEKNASPVSSPTPSEGHPCMNVPGKKRRALPWESGVAACVHARSTHFQRGSKQQNKMCRKDSKITFLCDITCKNSFSTEFREGILKVLKLIFLKNYSPLAKRRISCAHLKDLGLTLALFP